VGHEIPAAYLEVAVALPITVATPYEAAGAIFKWFDVFKEPGDYILSAMRHLYCWHVGRTGCQVWCPRVKT